VEGYLDLDAQLQPNGFDLTLREIASFSGPGTDPGVLTAHDAGRRLAKTTPLAFESDGSRRLAPGPYLITLNEVVNLPLDLMALGKPRSSLLRSGVAVHTAVWDAGYQGRSQALLVVYHPRGFDISRDARVMQMVFFRLEQAVEEGYRGRFQREGLAQP
jgi:dUTP pyrophosphatase